LQKYLPNVLSNLISPGTNFILKILSKENYLHQKFDEKEICGSIPIKDKANNVKGISDILMTEKDTKYIQWRYFENPLYEFYAIVYVNPGNKDILGRIVFTVQENIINIYEIYSQNNFKEKAIIGQFLKSIRSRHCDAISIKMLANNHICTYLKSYGFITRKEKISLLYAGNKKKIPESWQFFNGDRNI
jgi:hypothetical protein